MLIYRAVVYRYQDINLYLYTGINILYTGINSLYMTTRNYILDTTPSRYARFRSGGDEWKGTACDSSLKSLPVSVVHPQILGIACQLLPFVSSFVGLVTRPSCLTLLTPYERSRR